MTILEQRDAVKEVAEANHNALQVSFGNSDNQILINAQIHATTHSLPELELAKGGMAPLQPLQPGECRWGKSPVMRMDGTWTHPNRCYGDAVDRAEKARRN